MARRMKVAGLDDAVVSCAVDRAVDRAVPPPVALGSASKAACDMQPLWPQCTFAGST